MSGPVSGRLLVLPAPDRDGGEVFHTLVRSGAARIERIVSPPGSASPPDFWYDQDWDEFVVVVAGRASVAIEGEAEPRRLGPGDWLFLPARLRHRVAGVGTDEPAVWLAVHLGEPDGAVSPSVADQRRIDE